MAKLRLRDLADYRALLETHPEDWTRLDGLCRISISRFYRDQGVWRTLAREILPYAERSCSGFASPCRSRSRCWCKNNLGYTAKDKNR
jgi:chemotaxis protein methyltransferase CheR